MLVHGVPGDMETLAPVADALAHARRAITVSMRHAGDGPHGDRPFGTTQQRDDLADIVRSIGGPVDIVAWSFAAHGALGLAIERPDPVRSLYLCEPGFPTFVTDQAALDRIEADTRDAFGPVFAALAAGDSDAALRLAIDNAAGVPGWFDAQPEAIRRIHRRNAAMIPLLLRQTPPLPLTDEDLRRVRCPTTVAWGTETRVCYRLVSETAAHLIPGARAVRLPGNHLLPEAAPDLFAEDIFVHLRTLAR
ncbi:alpha/beta fold hydrolase [Rhodobacterales bacterium HKCCE2091]|nr:alpha/beta fold hydrolase [Rhodobacterales bacterium HKCCE2091]